MKKDSNLSNRVQKKLISIQELSEMIGICESTLYTWVKSKKINGVYKFRKCVRFDLKSVLQWISEHEVKQGNDQEDEFRDPRDSN